MTVPTPHAPAKTQQAVLPKALIFDVFGTLCDWRTGVSREVAGFFREKSGSFDALRFADMWRAEYQPAMERIRAGNRGYVPLDTLHRENLDIVLEKTGLEGLASMAERDELNHAWEKLPAWPEVPVALKRLSETFYLAPCSNGSIALMMRLARFAALPWDTIVGAEIAQNYKPELAVYLASCRALGLAPGEVMMVAAHNDDLEAARNAGLMTAFFPRKTEYGDRQTADVDATSNWDFVAENLTDLADKLGV